MLLCHHVVDVGDLKFWMALTETFDSKVGVTIVMRDWGHHDHFKVPAYLYPLADRVFGMLGINVVQMTTVPHEDASAPEVFGNDQIVFQPLRGMFFQDTSFRDGSCVGGRSKCLKRVAKLLAKPVSLRGKWKEFLPRHEGDEVRS